VGPKAFSKIWTYTYLKLGRIVITKTVHFCTQWLITQAGPNEIVAGVETVDLPGFAVVSSGVPSCATLDWTRARRENRNTESDLLGITVFGSTRKVCLVLSPSLPAERAGLSAETQRDQPTLRADRVDRHSRARRSAKGKRTALGSRPNLRPSACAHYVTRNSQSRRVRIDLFCWGSVHGSPVQKKRKRPDDSRCDSCAEFSFCRLFSQCMELNSY
jgi:hypothetical protein